MFFLTLKPFDAPWFSCFLTASVIEIPQEKKPLPGKLQLAVG